MIPGPVNHCIGPVLKHDMAVTLDVLVRFVPNLKLSQLNMSTSNKGQGQGHQRSRSRNIIV